MQSQSNLRSTTAIFFVAPLIPAKNVIVAADDSQLSYVSIASNPPHGFAIPASLASNLPYPEENDPAVFNYLHLEIFD